MQNRPADVRLGGSRAEAAFRLLRAGVLPGLILGGFISIVPCSRAAAQATCVSSLHASTQPVYPPIAKAAHVSGTVILLLAFAHDGTVENVKVLYGPEMLRPSATKFAQGIAAEPSPGSRECPYLVHYALASEGHGCDVQARVIPNSAPGMTFICIDTIDTPTLSDLASTITKRKND